MINETRGTTASLIQRGKPNTALQRTAVAFIAGMFLTAVLAYVPVIAGAFSSIFSQEYAVPAPSYAPPGDNTGGSLLDQQNTRAPVYAPRIEGTFSV